MQNLMEEFKLTNRRAFTKKILFAGLGIPLLSSFRFLDSSEKIKKITLLHTNDIHSHIDSFPKNHLKHPGLGGMRRIASLVNKIKSEEKNVILLDAGDIFQGTPYFNKYKGSLEFKSIFPINSICGVDLYSVSFFPTEFKFLKETVKLF